MESSFELWGTDVDIRLKYRRYLNALRRKRLPDAELLDCLSKPRFASPQCNIAPGIERLPGASVRRKRLQTRASILRIPRVQGAPFRAVSSRACRGNASSSK